MPKCTTLPGLIAERLHTQTSRMFYLYSRWANTDFHSAVHDIGRECDPARKHAEYAVPASFEASVRRQLRRGRRVRFSCDDVISHIQNPMYSTLWPSQGIASGATELQDGKPADNGQTAQVGTKTVRLQSAELNLDYCSMIQYLNVRWKHSSWRKDLVTCPT